MDATTQLPNLAALHLQRHAPAKPTAGVTPEAAAKAAKEFEALFLGQMMQQMFAGVGADSLFGGGHGEETFRSLLVDEYAKQIAKGPGLGLSGAIERQLLQLQEV